MVRKACFMVAIADMLPGWMAPVALWLIGCAERLVTRRAEQVFGAVSSIAREAMRPSPILVPYGRMPYDLIDLQQATMQGHLAYLQQASVSSYAGLGQLNSLSNSLLNGLSVLP